MGSKYQIIPIKLLKLRVGYSHNPPALRLDFRENITQYDWLIVASVLPRLVRLLAKVLPFFSRLASILFEVWCLESKADAILAGLPS